MASHYRGTRPPTARNATYWTCLTPFSAHSGALASHSGAVASEQAETPKKSSEPQGGHAPRFRPESVGLAALMASTAAVLLGLAIYLALHLGLLKGVPPDEVIRTTLTVMAGFAAVLTGVYAYRKQRVSEGDAKRADDEQLTQRYSTAAEKLGHEKAAVRLAGVIAMARLADDWSKQRQQCIDVLCAYLRMPTEQDGDLSERQVRATIVRTIAAHLREDSASSWAIHDFDFRGAALHDANFSGATFSGKTTFSGATFTGKFAIFDKATFTGNFTSFSEATFSGKITSFSEATFSGNVTSFTGAKFAGKSTTFYGATFSGEETTFDRATFSGEETTFYKAKFLRGHTSFDGAEFAGGQITFYLAKFSGEYTGFTEATFSGEKTTFDGAKFSEGETTFYKAKFSGGLTSFAVATFSGRFTRFDGATFSGEGTTFDGAKFSGEYTGFDGATFSGGTPADIATEGSSFVETHVSWGPITRRTLPNSAHG